MRSDAGDPRVRPYDLAFRSVVAWEPGPQLAAAFTDAWPSYRRWYLRDGDAARPSYAACVRALNRHMPELGPVFDRLVAAVGGGDLEARLLSQWNPPPLFAACSLATTARPHGALVRNYDYPPMLCDGILLATAFTGTRVLSMADLVWGALDGVNEHGLAVGIAFGGRPVVGEGFGIGLVVRYLLETCRTTLEAVETLSRIPVHLAYNVAIVDRSGSSRIVFVSPDREPVVIETATCANRQGTTEWPEHAVYCATEEREAVLQAATAGEHVPVASLLDTFLTAPVHRDTATTTWGTVYTAVYDTAEPSVELHWPGDSWRVELADPITETHTRRFDISLPEMVVAGADPVVTAGPAMIV